MSARGLVLAPLLAAATSLAAQAPASPPPGRLERFLREGIGLDDRQTAAALRGDPVVTVLEARAPRDIAVFGMVGVGVPRDVWSRRMRDFRSALRAATRPRFGVFGDPPAAADVDSVVITPRDVAEMRHCKPGDCVVKLPASDMARIRGEMDWSAPDLHERMTAYARRRLVEYVTEYRARGDAAMAVYDDRKTLNVRASEAFTGMLAESPYVYQNVPSVGRYFAAYPGDTLPDASEVLFWSEDVLPRLRPILSVTHQVVYTPPELPEVTIVAAKQIYANHYFEAAVDLTCAVDRPGGIYLLVLRRYRFDNLPSGGLLNIKGRATGALRDQLLADLRRQQTGAAGR